MMPDLHEAIYEMAHLELTLFFVPALYHTFIRPAPSAKAVSKPEGFFLLLLLPQLFLLGLARAQPHPSVDLETTLGVCYLEKEKFRRRSVTVFHKGRMLDENCTESWDVGHRSISTWGSASSSCGSPDNIDSPMAESNLMLGDRPERLRAADRAQRVGAWVDYGAYGETSLEDTSPWVLNKYSVKNNRSKRDEEIARVVESVSELSLSGPSSGIRQCSSRGGTKRGASSMSHGLTPNSGAAPNGPSQKRPRQSEDGRNEESENPEQNQLPGGFPPFSTEGKTPCPLPKECPNARFKTNSQVLQHIVTKHRDKCCPVCEENLVKNEDIWEYRGKLKDKIVFANEVDMKWHIHRMHLRPFQCPVCKEQYDKRGLKKHLGLYGKAKDAHALVQYDRNSIKAVLSGHGHTNLDYPEFEALVKGFDGALTKAQMKNLMFPGPNRLKIYDYEDRTDRLIGQTQPDPLVPEDPPFIFDFDSLPTLNGSSNQSTTSLKSIGDIKAKHGLTDEEINNLGWVIIEKLPKFLHMLEEILNSEDTRSHAAMVLAKIVQSEASRPPTQPFFNDYYFDDNIAPQQRQPPYLYGICNPVDSAYITNIPK